MCIYRSQNTAVQEWRVEKRLQHETKDGVRMKSEGTDRKIQRFLSPCHNCEGPPFHVNTVSFVFSFQEPVAY